eukprot:m.367967 g.367967  ORF g.367967 m.367967 type:complete len:55 (-) comp43101_c0_seq1:73-237(-)
MGLTGGDARKTCVKQAKGQQIIGWQRLHVHRMDQPMSLEPYMHSHAYQAKLQIG